MADQPLRILIVDDHSLYRHGLRRLLEERGFQVADVPSGREAIARVGELRPGVVLMDINMPEISGIEATRRLVAARPQLPVLMLTVNVDEATVTDAVRAGARGYLLKNAQLDSLVEGVQAAARGESTIAPQVTAGLLERVRRAPAELRGDAKVGGLTDRELEVLRLVASGCDNAEIARRLHLSQSTVKNHVASILDKLGVDNRIQAAVYAERVGLGEA